MKKLILISLILLSACGKKTENEIFLTDSAFYNCNALTTDREFCVCIAEYYKIRCKGKGLASNQCKDERKETLNQNNCLKVEIFNID